MVRPEHRRQRRRERQNRRREDDRDDAAGVHLQRDVRARPAIHPPSDHALGVLHGHPPVPALDEHDRADHQHHQHEQEDDPDRPHLAGAQLIERGDHGQRQADDDAGEDDQRHAVADAALGDLLAQPHDERRAGAAASAPSCSRKLQPGLVDQRDAAGHLGRPLEEQRDAERLDEASTMVP